MYFLLHSQYIQVRYGSKFGWYILQSFWIYVYLRPEMFLKKIIRKECYCLRPFFCFLNQLEEPDFFLSVCCKTVFEFTIKISHHCITVPYGVVVSSLNSRTRNQIPSLSFHFSCLFHNLSYWYIPNVSPVLKYAKIVVPSVGLMSKFPILALPKASDCQHIITIEPKSL